MNKQIVLAVVFTAMLFPLTQAFAGTVTATVEKEISSGGIRQVNLVNDNGDVEFLASNDGKIAIHAVTRIIGDSDSECERYLNNTAFEVKRSAVAIDIKAPRLANDNYLRTITYTVLIPSDIDVNAKTINGSIACRDLNGDLDINSSTGDIELMNCTGRLNGNTTEGDIVVESTSREAYFETTNGNLDLYVALFDNGRMRVNSTNGTVRIHLPGDANASISARTSNGMISCGSFENALTVNRNRTYANGRLGYGEGSIIVETVNGGISFDTYNPQVVAEPPVANTASNNTVIYKTTPVVVEHRYVDVFGRPCYPRFHHFWRPWRTVWVPPIRINIGSRHWDRRDDHHGWRGHRNHDHDWDRDRYHNDHRKPRHRR